jgi:16S rRNA (uracil1498-N3)-methyltransferase
MKIQRFYKENIEIKNEEIILDDKNLLNQLLNVFRVDVGYNFNLFGKVEINNTTTNKDVNKEYLVEIISKGKKEIICKVINEVNILQQKSNIILAFANLKNSHTELVLEKCTELGVINFEVLVTDRTIKTGLNMERAGKILIEATEQSGFGVVPTLDGPKNLKDFLVHLLDTKQSLENVFVLDMGENTLTPPNSSLRSTLVRGGTEHVVLLIGPEGGWSDAERELFKSYKLKTFSLGSQTLRAETACIAAVTVFSF